MFQVLDNQPPRRTISVAMATQEHLVDYYVYPVFFLDVIFVASLYGYKGWPVPYDGEILPNAIPRRD